nr:immunoglobulin heavy chain junction region [Mus musculus]
TVQDRNWAGLLT